MNIIQSGSNRADFSDSGNVVSQNVDQNAWSSGGGNIWQDADNVANVGGWGNQVDQDINQNACGSEIVPVADNWANIKVGTTA